MDGKDNDLNLNRHDPSFLENYKFVKYRILINSIDQINDFCKIMITLVSGFFAVYFALLKFLNISATGSSSPVSNYIFLPSILFILSIGLLILCAKPMIFFGHNQTGEKLLNTIKHSNRSVLLWKYLPMLAGMILFIIGLAFTLIINICILGIMCL